MKTFFLPLCICFLASGAFAQIRQKHAFLIGISNYRDQAWDITAGASDCDLMYYTLQARKFDSFTQLKNEKATAKAIRDGIDDLKKSVHAGDLVVIYYSGHGKSLPDNDQDELDGMDEALVPYDGAQSDARNCIRDDEVKRWIEDLSHKLGARGHLVILFDGCYLGEATRGKAVGKGFGVPGASTDDHPNDLPANSSNASWVFVAACQANEHAYSVKNQNQSVFTFALAKILNSDEPLANYHQLETALRRTCYALSPLQSPWLEGDLDRAILDGAYTPLPAYFRARSISQKVVEVYGWPLLQAHVGDQVVFYQLKSVIDTATAALASGKITAIRLPLASVTLTNPWSGDWDTTLVALLRRPPVPIFMRIEPGITKKAPQLVSALRKIRINPISSQTAELFLTEDVAHNNVVLSCNDGRELGSWSIQDSLSLVNRIRKYQEAASFRALDMQSEATAIQVRIQRDSLPGNSVIADGSSLFEQERIWINIDNKTDQDLYFNMLELYDTDSLSVMYPYKNCPPPACKILAGHFASFRIKLTPPYSGVQYKVIATSRLPFDLRSQIASSNRGANNNNPATADMKLRNCLQLSRRDAHLQGQDYPAEQPIDVETVRVVVKKQ